MQRSLWQLPITRGSADHSSGYKNHGGMQAELTLLLRPDWSQVEYRSACTRNPHRLLDIGDPAPARVYKTQRVTTDQRSGLPGGGPVLSRLQVAGCDCRRQDDVSAAPQRRALAGPTFPSRSLPFPCELGDATTRSTVSYRQRDATDVEFGLLRPGPTPSRAEFGCTAEPAGY